VEQEDTMPSAFPHHYDVEVVAGSSGGAVLASGRPDIIGGAPPEFDGRADWWSPEHLLLSALGLCLMTTFQAFAARAGLHVARYASRVDGVLDKTPSGLAFTSIRVVVDLGVSEADQARAQQLLASAKRHCIVSNALKTPVEVESVVAVAS
jgi:organic hydroperoxide reductase OsmC/OhrA